MHSTPDTLLFIFYMILLLGIWLDRGKKSSQQKDGDNGGAIVAPSPKVRENVRAWAKQIKERRKYKI